MCMHARMHMCLRTYTYAAQHRFQMCLCRCFLYTCAHAYVLTCANVRACTRTRLHMHARTFTHVSTNTCTHACAHVPLHGHFEVVHACMLVHVLTVQTCARARPRCIHACQRWPMDAHQNLSQACQSMGILWAIYGRNIHAQMWLGGSTVSVLFDAAHVHA